MTDDQFELPPPTQAMFDDLNAVLKKYELDSDRCIYLFADAMVSLLVLGATSESNAKEITHSLTAFITSRAGNAYRALHSRARMN